MGLTDRESNPVRSRSSAPVQIVRVNHPVPSTIDIVSIFWP
jgi:hypothetical protein